VVAQDENFVGLSRVHRGAVASLALPVVVPQRVERNETFRWPHGHVEGSVGLGNCLGAVLQVDFETASREVDPPSDAQQFAGVDSSLDGA